MVNKILNKIRGKLNKGKPKEGKPNKVDCLLWLALIDWLYDHAASKKKANIVLKLLILLKLLNVLKLLILLKLFNVLKLLNILTVILF